MLRRNLSVRLAAALLLVAGTAGGADAAPRDVAVRAIAQEGLAIGMASSVLFSQLVTVFASDGSFGPVGRCSHQFGTDFIVRKLDKTGPGAVAVAVDFFTDEGCAKRYINADLDTKTTRADAGNTIATQGVSTYFDSDEKQIGKLSLSSDWFVHQGRKDDVIFLATGFGRFKPEDGAAPVDLALSCDLSKAILAILADTAKATVPCQGAVGQRFPSQGQYIGAVEPLTLTWNTRTDRVAFAGTASRTVTASKPIRFETGNAVPKLAFASPVQSFGSTTATGRAAQFAMLPDVPTGWSLIDEANGLVFRIDVVSSETRNLKGSVRTTGGALRATFALDQSGTGTIRYSGGPAVPVTSWLLSD